MTSQQMISVIIPAGRPHQAVLTVRSLLAQTLPRSQYEIIVVTPNTGELAVGLAHEVRIVPSAQLFPPGHMRNIGARNAHGEVLCFIDDDCQVPQNFLEEIVSPLFSAERVAAVGCRVVSSEERFWDKCADHALFTAYQHRKSGSVMGLGSAALAVRREAFKNIGGFDEQLRASEDWDLSLKLIKKGWQCWFNATVSVGHDHKRGSFGKIMNAARNSGLLSGLTVQQRHQSIMSIFSRLILQGRHPAIYWLFILPYSTVLTLLWLIEAQPGIRTICYFPIVFSAKFSYQIGVWEKIYREHTSRV